MESTSIRKGDDLSELLSLHEPRLGRILPEREVGSRAVVVPGVVRKDPEQMALVENDDVVEALAA